MGIVAHNSTYTSNNQQPKQLCPGPSEKNHRFFFSRRLRRRRRRYYYCRRHFLRLQLHRHRLWVWETLSEDYIVGWWMCCWFSAQLSSQVV